MLQLGRIGEGQRLGIGLDEEIEGVDDREVGDEVDLDLEAARRFRKDEARQPVAVRILLPVDEMPGRLDFHRIGDDPRLGVGRGPQPDDLRRKRDRAVIVVGRAVVEGGDDRQGRSILAMWPTPYRLPKMRQA